MSGAAVEFGEKDSDLPSPLRPYQRVGVRFLLTRECGLVADDMGLGKTVQVAVALSKVLPKCERRRALIVVPASLRLNWERELGKWSPDLSVRRLLGTFEDRFANYRLPVNVLIASYDQVRRDALKLSSEVCFDVVVLDEVQRIKNADSDTALACRILQRDRSWALTGTPIENEVRDLVSIFRFVRPSLLNLGMSKREMHAQMKHFFIRRRKCDVLRELPQLIVQDLPLELSGSQREAYDRLWNRRIDMDKAHGGSSAGLLALLTKLKQICNFDPQSNESTKLEALVTILESLSSKGDKMILFSQYVETLKWLSSQLKDDLDHDIFYGGLNDKARQDVIRDFKEKPGPRLLLVSLKAGGVGLNLQDANFVVLFDRWWNPAVEQQAIGRAHRIGQEKTLHVFRFLVIDSVEERIAELLEKKRKIFEKYINDAESASVPAVGRNELLEILDMNNQIEAKGDE